MPKHSIRGLLSLFLIAFTCLPLSAQLEEDQFHYGFTAGATSFQLQDVRTTLIRPVFREDTYTAGTEQRLGFTAGAFVYYKFNKSDFAIQPEIYYADMGGNFNYADINSLNYDIGFRYSYIQISPNIKFYLMKGLYAAAGPQLGLILNRSNLSYVSSQPELGPDLQIQQSLREVLKGNSMVSAAFGFGYDAPMGLSINFKYVMGISDSMETLANGFYFIENKNLNTGMLLTLGYAIPFFN